ncbi:hypothetical protein BT93_H1550 [Corymbia citriodora subsp. variegata]|nr:hypothetical protein BT93_H1550 [Corymbia citriodora subsp. variegata]
MGCRFHVLLPSPVSIGKRSCQPSSCCVLSKRLDLALFLSKLLDWLYNPLLSNRWKGKQADLSLKTCPMKRLLAETSRTSASAVAESFTEDILIEILSRLPVKSLGRFKCVSKQWQSLISDPGFTKSHLQRLKAGDIIPSQRIVKSPLETIDYELLDGDTGGGEGSMVVKSHEIRMADPSWEPGLMGCCDGLVCLTVSDGFLLYNPTTKEFRNLPGSDLVQGDDFFHGFGYDSISDDYKIVQGDGSTNCQVAIFSLKSGSWRKIHVQQESHRAVYDRGVYWKGALHWCVVDGSRSKKESAIMSFDLSEEKFHQVLFVPEVDGDLVFDGVGIHGADLFTYPVSSIDRFEAWKTNEYGRGGSWTKLFSVSAEGIPGGEYWQIPVAYTRSGKIVFLIDVYQIILFNPEDNTYKEYPIEADDDIRWRDAPTLCQSRDTVGRGVQQFPNTGDTKGKGDQPHTLSAPPCFRTGHLRCCVGRSAPSTQVPLPLACTRDRTNAGESHLRLKSTPIVSSEPKILRSRVRVTLRGRRSNQPSPCSGLSKLLDSV